MKKVLSVFLVLGLLLSIGFASTSVTKIPKKSPSQNFVESIDSYLHYELINPAASKEFKDQIRFFMNERERTKSFNFDLMPSGKVFITSGKAILKIENKNFITDVLSNNNISYNNRFVLPEVIQTCWKVWKIIQTAYGSYKTAEWVCKNIPHTSDSGSSAGPGPYHHPVSRCLTGK